MSLAINCRGCGKRLSEPFLDMGMSPLANSYLNDPTASELWENLSVCFCSSCYLVQLTYDINPKILYTDYAYFSSYSDAFLEHAKELVRNLYIRKDSKVMEIASNDGYLLQYVKDITPNILGIEPAKNIAKVANERGINTINEFFDLRMAREIVNTRGTYDWIIGNNVLAHVPNINEFIEGVKLCLAPHGMAAFEFPYLYMLLKNTEFDTIYHEHVFYYSVIALKRLFSKHDMIIFSIKFSDIHGGSIQIRVGHKSGGFYEDPSVGLHEMLELAEGLNFRHTYHNFASDVQMNVEDLKYLINDLKSQGATIAAYGAPAKGNTLLNLAKLTKDDILFTVDRSLAKQGKYLPGSHIPIYAPEELITRNPDYALLLPWNFADEIKQQMKDYKGKFIIPVPFPHIYEISR